MKNFVMHGDVVTAVAPSGGVVSGAGVLLNAQFGVASTSAAQGEEFEMRLTGVFDLVAEGAGSGQAFAFGELVYWDNTNKRCTKTSSGNTLIGKAMAAKLTAATSIRVKITG